MPHKGYNMTVNTCDVVNEQNRVRIDAVANKLINDNNKTINLEKRKRHNKEALIIKTTSFEECVNLSEKELLERIKQPYTKVISVINSDGTFNVITEKTDKV